ncbi:MAG: hypothetical protein HY927_03630 [Elusimicrobia bacterium]|nr:hypothetical protein [Elusimicrobiota bacterium]
MIDRAMVLCLCAILLVAAPASSAPALDASARPDSIGWFDGAGPLVRVVPEGAMPRFVPAPEPLRGPSLIRVMAEVKVLPVSDMDRQATVLALTLESLRRGHGFLTDASYQAGILSDDGEAHSPGPRPFVYVVRGFILDTRALALSRDKSVRKTWLDSSQDESPLADRALASFAQEQGDAIASVEGVVGVGLGWDCGVPGDHRHILPHKPAVVITLKPGADRSAVHARLLFKVPSLSQVSRLLVFPGLGAGASGF